LVLREVLAARNSELQVDPTWSRVPGTEHAIFHRPKYPHVFGADGGLPPTDTSIPACDDPSSRHEVAAAMAELERTKAELAAHKAKARAEAEEACEDGRRQALEDKRKAEKDAAAANKKAEDGAVAAAALGAKAAKDAAAAAAKAAGEAGAAKLREIEGARKAEVLEIERKAKEEAARLKQGYASKDELGAYRTRRRVRCSRSRTIATRARWTWSATSTWRGT
jgi:hypothetical protein